MYEGLVLLVILIIALIIGSLPRKCPQCGEEYDAKVVYCMNCGHRVKPVRYDEVFDDEDDLMDDLTAWILIEDEEEMLEEEEYYNRAH